MFQINNLPSRNSFLKRRVRLSARPPSGSTRIVDETAIRFLKSRQIIQLKKVWVFLSLSTLEFGLVPPPLRMAASDLPICPRPVKPGIFWIRVMQEFSFSRLPIFVPVRGSRRRNGHCRLTAFSAVRGRGRYWTRLAARRTASSCIPRLRSSCRSNRPRACGRCWTRLARLQGRALL